ncbi:MAG: PEP-CTERM sorting domain-containing protein [Burkholderiales bacterium]|nr:PEP-CTERM sorting domain-containing protein [Burkholderiales bacterium]
MTLSHVINYQSAAIAVALLAGFASSAQAEAISGQGTWETTLQARYFTNDHGHGPDAFYDKDLDITWLADANALAYDYRNYYANSPLTQGIAYYTEAQSWLGSLVEGGVSGWRLPQVNNLGWTSCGGTPVCGSNVPSNSSELAHLFYTTLGDKDNVNPITHEANQPGFGLSNTGPFLNLQSGKYLEELPRQIAPSVWSFDMAVGDQWDNAYTYPGHVFAVHDGDIGSPIPEPGTSLLLTFGLVGLTVMRRWSRS